MLSVFTEAITHQPQNSGQPLFSHWRGRNLTDNETDTEEEPGYQTEGEEGPVQNDLKEEPMITEEPRTMAT